MSKIKEKLNGFKEKHPALFQFIGFGIVGTSGLLFMLVTYYIFIYLKFDPQVANFAGFITSTACVYYLNFVYVFHGKGKVEKGSAFKFFFLYLILYFMSAYFVYLMVDVMHISKLLTPIINSILITPPSFLGSKYWVFKKTKVRG